MKTTFCILNNPPPTPTPTQIPHSQRSEPLPVLYTSTISKMAATTSSPRTSTNFSSNVTLQQTRLYVAPTEKSLTAFKAICDDIALRDTITEIVFLGVAHTFSEYDVMDLDTFKESCEEKLSCGLFTLPDNFVVDDDTLTEAYIMYDELAVAHMEDDAMFDELVTYLPKLPNLFQAGIQHKIDKPGLNEDPYFFAKDYVSADGNMAHRQSRNGCERLAYEALGPGDGALRREVAIGAFVQALHVAQGVLITHLSIGNGLHDQLWHNIAGAGQDAPEENSLHHVAANLTHLHVSVSDDINKVDDPMWREFLTAAKQLKSLTIHTEWGWDDVVWHTPQEKGSMLSVVLPHLTFKKLKTFRIIGKLDQPTNVRAIW